MAREFIDFDTSPINETSVGVSKTEDYLPAMRAEAKRMLELLEKRFKNLPGEFMIKSVDHDFGIYLEIRYYFDRDEEGWESCNFVESNYPSTWDDDAEISFK